MSKDKISPGETYIKYNNIPWFKVSSTSQGKTA